MKRWSDFQGRCSTHTGESQNVDAGSQNAREVSTAAAGEPREMCIFANPSRGVTAIVNDLFETQGHGLVPLMVIAIWAEQHDASAGALAPI